MAILKIKDKGVWKEIQAIKGDTGHDVYVGDKSKAPSEAKLIIEPVKGTATGTDIQITDSVNDRVSKLVLDGKSTQETRSGKNIIKNEGINQTINGITYTINNDKSITCKGTATARSEFYLYNNSSNPLPIKPNTTYINTTNIMVILNTDNGYKAFMPKSSLDTGSATQIRRAYIRVENGESINETLYPMLSEQGGEYEPYGVSPSPDYPSEIENVKGKNLFDKNKKAILINAKKDILNTGVRSTLTSPVDWARIYIDIGKKELLGKTISYGAEFFVSGQNGGRIALYFGSSTSEAIQLISYLEQTGTKTTTIPSKFPSGADRINILFYASTRDAGNIGDYVDYTNLMVFEGSMPNKYVPYGNIQIVETGKNIAKFDQSKNTNINSWIYTSNVANNITATKKGTDDSFYATFVANVVKGEQYVFSTSTSNRIIMYCYSDKLWGTDIKGLSAVGLSSAVPLKFTSNYTGQMIIGLYGTTTSVEAKDFQLEKGTTVTPYEPYKEEVVNIGLKGNELCSLPNGTKDELIVKDGRAKIVKRIGKVVLDGSGDWRRADAVTSGNYYFYIDNVLSNVLYDSNNRFIGLSNIGITSSAYREVEGVDIIYYQSKNRTRVYTETTKSMSLSEFKTWLSTHNTIVQYELAEPEEIDLGEVSTLTTYEGTSNITNSEDAEMSIEYDTNKTNLYYQNNGNIIKMNEGS